MEQVAEWRKQAIVAREEVIRKRAENFDQVRRRLDETIKLIQAKHAAVRNSMNKESIYRQVGIRVNRGLEELGKFIRVLQDTNMSDEQLKMAIQGSLSSDLSANIERRTTISDFVISIQKQLIMQTEFINIAAHELRTPIMPILINAEILDAQLEGKSEEIKVIIRNAVRLQHLAKQVLDLARIEGKSLIINKEEFDLNLLLSNIISDQQSLIGNKNVKLVKLTETSIRIKADKDKITEVVSNLIDNAIKFTKIGEILVSAEIEADHVIVKVSDTGLGIDPKLFPVLFSKFVTTSEKGTGLGLYLSKNLVEAHGGTIWAKNNDNGQGATFFLILPL